MFTEMKKDSQIFQDSSNTYYPEDELQVSDIVKELYKKNQPTELIGTGTKNFIGNKIQAAKKLSLSKLSGIVEYLPEELYIKVKANTSLELVEQELEKNNQELAFEDSKRSSELSCSDSPTHSLPSTIYSHWYTCELT